MKENKGLSELTKEKMKKEYDNDIVIDELIYDLNREHKKDRSDILMLVERVRSYRKEVFDLKLQISDINKAYSNLNIETLKVLYGGRPNTKEYNEQGYNGHSFEECYNTDVSRIIIIVHKYYENILKLFRQELLEEKAIEGKKVEKDNKEELVLDLE